MGYIHTRSILHLYGKVSQYYGTFIFTIANKCHHQASQYKYISLCLKYTRNCYCEYSSKVQLQNLFKLLMTKMNTYGCRWIAHAKPLLTQILFSRMRMVWIKPSAGITGS